MELVAVLCAAVAVFGASKVSGQGVVNLTADVSCPERVVTLTCIVENVPSTSLGWTHDSGLIIDDAVGYIFIRGDPYPLQVDVSSVMGILNFTIFNASVESGDGDFIVELIIDLDVLYTELGYRSLQCGSVVLDENFDFATRLGIRAPQLFKIDHVDLIYSAKSPDRLEELFVQTERPSYSSTMCPLFLNTSIAGTVVRTIAVNDSNCMEDVCSVKLTDVVDGAGDVELSVAAGNRFENTTAIPSNIRFPLSSVDFTLTYTSDCNSTAECTAPSQTALELVICDVFYGRDSSYQSSQQIQGLFNEPLVISALEASTNYYVEAVLHTRSNEVDIFYHFRTNFTTGTNDCNASYNSYNWNLVVVAMTVFFLTILAFTTILLTGFGLQHYCKSKPKNQEALMNKNVAYGQSRSQIQLKDDLYAEVS